MHLFSSSLKVLGSGLNHRRYIQHPSKICLFSPYNSQSYSFGRCLFGWIFHKYIVTTYCMMFPFPEVLYLLLHCLRYDLSPTISKYLWCLPWKITAIDAAGWSSFIIQCGAVIYPFLCTFYETLYLLSTHLAVLLSEMIFQHKQTLELSS